MSGYESLSSATPNIPGLPHLQAMLKKDAEALVAERKAQDLDRRKTQEEANRRAQELLLKKPSLKPFRTIEQEKKEQLAVMDLNAKYGVDKGLADALSDIIRDEIHSFGEYEVLSRDDLDIVAKRESMQQKLGCDDDNICLITFGNAIGTKYMVAGALSKIGDTYSINLRLLDTKGKDAGVKKRINQTCKCAEGELINSARIAAALVMRKGESRQNIKDEDLSSVINEKPLRNLTVP